MDISRRKALGLLGLGGGIGLAGCSTTENLTGAPGKSPVEVSFEHGVASGDATSAAVILWTRVTPAEKVESSLSVQVVMATSRGLVEGLETGASTEPGWTGIVRQTSTSASRDYTVKLDMDGLDDDQVYFFRFMVDTPSGPVWSPIGKTRTLPATGGDKLALAVVSCSNWPFGFFNVYKAIAQRDDVDAVVHLGDYIYEYGIDGYGGEVGERLGRRHDPVTEIVTLEDYRTRHRQYKSDPDLQAAHAAAPWYCTWDDHESTNNSYRVGAENHNPEENEGDWTTRKQIAVQAYFEWMPVREPVSGMAREAFYRKVDFGDLATIFLLESRLLGRSEEISWFDELTMDMSMPELMAKAGEVRARVDDPSRTMLGQVQEDWLNKGLKSSVETGRTWQLLANQVIMAEVRIPPLQQMLTAEEKAKIAGGFGEMMMAFAPLNQPWNLDAWDGFPAARKRLYTSAKEAGARIVTVTGDTHTAWANELNDGDDLVGVEFGCTSVSSPGMGMSVPLERLGPLTAEANKDVVWHDPFGSGFTMLTLTPEKAVADFYKVTTILEKDFEVEWVAGYESSADANGMSPLKSVV
ncbi:MAG: alkaline phosphatase [Ponticaulis sp.]|nr:alkaline phosphatase [Ponticaulis sp.]|tara:strand:- start:203858 stop:205597 length:1740 start_codon:yes stop_codon:yes gene_type:complete